MKLKDIKNLFNSYGYYFSLHRRGIHIMINGRYFAFFKGCNTGKWTFNTWENYWRKYKVKIGKK